MAFIADTHVHLYPRHHDLGAALRSARNALARSAPGLPPLLCLTERHDCRMFEELRDGARPPPAGYTVRPAGPRSLALAHADGPLYLLAGCQLAVAGRLEVLGLAMTERPRDGLEATEAIATIEAAGGLPVLAWGVGKWLGARGARIRELAARHPGVLLGDSSLRPPGWRDGCLAAFPARTLAGTDPLPAPGEERHTGRYATRFEASFDPGDPARSLVDAVRAGAPRRSVGHRCGWLAMWSRRQAMKRADGA